MTEVAAAGNVAADGAQGGDAGAPAQPHWSEVLKSTLFRMMFFWMIMNWFKGGSNQTQAPKANPDGTPAPQAVPTKNLFPNNMMYDFSAYLSNSNQVDFENDIKFWEKEKLTYGLWTEGETGDSIFYKKSTLDLENEYAHLKNNGSLFLHSFFYPTGSSPDPKNDLYRPGYVAKSMKKMNKIKRRKYQETHNLLSGATEKEEDREKSGTVEYLSHWHGNLTISLVYDQTNWPEGKIPPPLDKVIRFDGKGQYFPIVFLNDWWNLQEDYKPINKTDTTLDIHICLQPLSLMKLQLYLSQSYNNEMMGMLGQDPEEAESDKDAMKKMILETQPWLLALTIAVSISHTVFEMLAFKNDIQFWKTRDNLQGLSIRAVMFNCFCQLIVLLYVCDNDTNFMIKVSIGVGLLIECWKLTKCLKPVHCEPGEGIFGSSYKFKENRKEEDSETSKFDKMAFKYLGMVCFPLATCYIVYSLYYNEHKGWYSFVLQSAYGFLLTFGFIAMTPQLFINYKIKSVAHLPWRMMTYKALNTFIDDLFAFVIQMPMLYRIGTLRDDVIFLIFLYQNGSIQLI